MLAKIGLAMANISNTDVRGMSLQSIRRFATEDTMALSRVPQGFSNNRAYAEMPLQKTQNEQREQERRETKAAIGSTRRCYWPTVRVDIGRQAVEMFIRQD